MTSNTNRPLQGPVDAPICASCLCEMECQSLAHPRASQAPASGMPAPSLGLVVTRWVCPAPDLAPDEDCDERVITVAEVSG